MTLDSCSGPTRPATPALGWIAAALVVAVIATGLVAGTVAAAPNGVASSPAVCLRAL